MDKIFLNEMEFYGYHGVLPEEGRLGQRFRVSVVLETNFQEAGLQDDLTKTISYVDVYELCKKVVEQERYQLIEAVAERIANQVLKMFQKIHQVTVKVIKPDPPIPGHYQSVAVEITRSHRDYE